MSFFANNFNIPPGRERKLPIPLEVGSNFDIPPVAHNRAEGTIRNDQRSLLHTAGVWGCCKPPAGPGQSPGGGPGGEGPGSSRNIVVRNT